jgi:uncharacterized protein (DUF4415 family)
MRRNKRGTGRKWLKSDFRRFDVHVIQPHEYDDAPELTEKQLANAVLQRNGVPVKRGRPRVANPKQHVSLRLDADVLSHYKRKGRGWQRNVNDVLKRAMTRERKRA